MVGDGSKNDGIVNEFVEDVEKVVWLRADRALRLRKISVVARVCSSG